MLDGSYLSIRVQEQHWDTKQFLELVLMELTVLFQRGWDNGCRVQDFGLFKWFRESNRLIKFRDSDQPLIEFNQRVLRDGNDAESQLDFGKILGFVRRQESWDFCIHRCMFLDRRIPVSNPGLLLEFQYACFVLDHYVSPGVFDEELLIKIMALRLVSTMNSHLSMDRLNDILAPKLQSLMNPHLRRLMPKRSWLNDVVQEFKFVAKVPKNASQHRFVKLIQNWVDYGKEFWVVFPSSQHAKSVSAGKPVTLAVGVDGIKVLETNTSFVLEEITEWGFCPNSFTFIIGNCDFCFRTQEGAQICELLTEIAQAIKAKLVAAVQNDATDPEQLAFSSDFDSPYLKSPSGEREPVVLFMRKRSHSSAGE
jgi:hypothetical protein